MKNAWESLPEKFLLRLKLVITREKLDSVLASYCMSKPTTLRANGLKISPQELENQLSEMGFNLEKVAWQNQTFILKNRSQRELTETKFYREGFFYLQSLSSLVPALVLDPKPGEKVLDLCAAPGSKTTQMAALMANRGEIYANDQSHLRGYKLRANLELQGVKIAKVFEYPGEIFWKTFPEQFDRTLVDVPCSLEGRFNCHDSKSYDDWSIKKIKKLSDQQKWLLRSAISCTKPGGTIVYSTCTLAPEENEEIIDWILKKEAEALELEPIVIDGLATDPPLSFWKEKRFDSIISRAVRILPSERMEGFFVAKIRKLESTVRTRSAPDFLLK